MALGDGIRRNVATVSTEERNRLRDAFLQLDNAKFYPDGVSYWDKQEDIHKEAHLAGQDVHGGPAFLPWHRELCNRLEALLREVDPEISLHYWDWTTDPRSGLGGAAPLFTNVFMGSANGDAGVPLQDFESTEGAAHPKIWRSVNAGAPGAPPVPSDNTVLTSADGAAQADQYHEFWVNDLAHPNSLENAHDTAHGYIGGTIAKQHFSFHDPFVFLIHSNVDRLWAMWQRAAGHSWRLDPDQTYGKEGGDPSIGADLEPWSGTEPPLLRPWAAPDNQQLRKTSKDPSVISPPHYDTSPSEDLQVLGLTDLGGDWHTIRRANGTWQNSFGDVKAQENNDPGKFTAVGCAGVGGNLHVVGLTDDGKMWHTIRRANGTWQDSFGDVKAQENNDPGKFTAVGCAGVG